MDKKDVLFIMFFIPHFSRLVSFVLEGYPIMVEDENSSGIILLIPNRTNSYEDGAGFAVSDLTERSSE